jgi:hypothetical protein
MDPITFTTVAVAIVTYLANTKGGKQAQDDLSSTFWNDVKGIFIEEDEEFVKDLEASPEDEDLVKELEFKLKRKSKKDGAFAGQLKGFFESLNDGKEGSPAINQSNVHGDNIGGDKNIYHK